MWFIVWVSLAELGALEYGVHISAWEPALGKAWTALPLPQPCSPWCFARLSRRPDFLKCFKPLVLNLWVVAPRQTSVSKTVCLVNHHSSKFQLRNSTASHFLAGCHTGWETVLKGRCVRKIVNRYLKGLCLHLEPSGVTPVCRSSEPSVVMSHSWVSVRPATLSLFLRHHFSLGQSALYLAFFFLPLLLSTLQTHISYSTDLGRHVCPCLWITAYSPKDPKMHGSP